MNWRELPCPVALWRVEEVPLDSIIDATAIRITGRHHDGARRTQSSALD
jgi:hypothetical protein